MNSLGMADGGAPLPKLRVVLAEDDELIASLIVLFLTNAGCTVERTTNGNAAWEILVRDFSRVDLLITDHQMPYCTGLQLVIKLRAAGFSAPIIVQSGSVGPAETESYLKAGIQKIIPKATRETELIEIVQAVIGRSD